MKTLPLVVSKIWPMLFFVHYSDKDVDARAMTLAPRTYLSLLAKLLDARSAKSEKLRQTWENIEFTKLNVCK